MREIPSSWLIVCYSNVSQYDAVAVRELVGNSRLVLIDAHGPIFGAGVLGAVRRAGRFLLGRKTRDDWWMSAERMRDSLLSAGVPSAKIEVGLSISSYLGKTPTIHRLLQAFRVCISNLGGTSKEFELAGVESSRYLLDSIQRWIPGFRVEKRFSLYNAFGLLIYLRRALRVADYVANLIRAEQPTGVLINHQVYFESGWIARIAEEREVPVYFGSPKTSGFWPIGAQNHWAFDFGVRRYLGQPSERTITGRASSWEPVGSIKEIEDLRSRPLDTSKVYVFLHSFTDANHVHRMDSIFPSFYHWVVRTLRVAEKTPAKTFIFRSHPASKYYPGDYRILKRLFRRPVGNVTLVHGDEEGDIFRNGVPMVVTSHGTIALEMACAGIRAITAATPLSAKGTFLKANSADEYATYLQEQGAGLERMLRLTDSERNEALEAKRADGRYFAN